MDDAREVAEMARMVRVVVAGAPHHVTQRGNRRQQTFFRDGDYRAYVALAGEHCRRCGVAIWAWCLMPNHVHLVAVPETASGLAEAVGETHRLYARQIHFRTGWRGYFWQGRFASVAMDEAHLYTAVRYVELNPVRARLVDAAEDWPWSSARAHLRGEVDGLTETGALAARIPDWRAYLDAAADGDAEYALRRHTRTGRPVGSEAFIADLEERLGMRLRPRKPGPKPKGGSDRDA